LSSWFAHYNEAPLPAALVRGYSWQRHSRRL
jgi:hypothetical protein